MPIRYKYVRNTLKVPKKSINSGVLNIHLNKRPNPRFQIFKTKKISKVGKNGNMPKFICKVYLEYFNKYKHSIFKEDEETLKLIERYNKKKKREAKTKNSFYSIQHMKEFFHLKNNHQSHLSRKMLSTILGK